MAASPGSQSQGTGLDCFTSRYLFPSVVNKLAISYNYNPLILSSTSHSWRFGDTQLKPGDPRRSTCLNLPRDPVPGKLSCLSMLRDPSAQDPRKSTCLDLPRDLVPGRLSCLNLLRDPPVPGIPGGQHASTCPGTQFSGDLHASTCLGIQSPGGCHASAYLGICTLTQGRLALRLQQY